MKTVNKVFQIELTENEIELITTALHGEYKFIRAEREKADQDSAPRLYEKMQAVKAIRNSFADLVNRRYMGEDA